MLLLAKNLEQEIRDHGAKDYPNECCGAMLGTDGDAGREVRALFPLVNRRDDSPRNRFSITPDDFRAAERAASERGFDLLGWYHSHPDHPARWSPTDFAEAHWIGCSYVITSVEKGKAAVTNSFELAGSDEADKKLLDEKIEIAFISLPR